MSWTMRRLSLYLGFLSWGSRLQMLAVLLILGYWVWLDVQRGIWPVSIAIILLAAFVGAILMPLMVAYPRQSFRIWSSFGIVYLVVYLVARDQWWWRTVLAHFCREFAMWLELSCGYWFVSELRLRQERLAAADSSERDEFSTGHEDHDVPSSPRT